MCNVSLNFLLFCLTNSKIGAKICYELMTKFLLGLIDGSAIWKSNIGYSLSLYINNKINLSIENREILYN
jgi:hypothetical protein